MMMDRTEDILRIARIVGPLIDNTVNEFFAAYKDLLIDEPMTYVVPAIWGASKEGALDDIQKEINSRIAPVVDSVYDCLELDDLSVAQIFAIQFIIRGLVISKIIYMIEAVKNRTDKKAIHKKDPYSLETMEPLGKA